MQPDDDPRRFYTNPVLSYDVPDPDAIRLRGGGYAMVASSFDRRPGLPLWHSPDLVEWTPAGFAGGFAEPLRPDGGVWAPALRERGGRLWITWADPDRGVFVVDAPALTGPWSEPRLVIAGPGPIDPCPFWDGERAWIVHAWARSRAGFANRLDIVEVDPGLTRTVSAPRVLIDGDAIPGCSVLEGPKLYRRGEDLWVFAPAGGVESGWQYAFRAASLDGPWEHRIVLQQGASEINGPHQGAWLEGAGGREWFLHFQHTPLYGRILHLQPLEWGSDGWPRIGHAVGGGPAEPVRSWRRPPRDGTGPVGAAPRAPWHGRGADPADIETLAADGTRRLSGDGCLAVPLDARARSISLDVLDGVGELLVIGGETRRVRTEVTGEQTAGDGASARTPRAVRLGVVIDGEVAHFTIDGARAGEPFALAPRRWTGVEIGIAAGAGRPATFGPLEITTV